MNDKKGFTLVELMAILVILGVLLLMAMPSITKTFRDSRGLEEEEYVNNLCIGAQSYMEIEKDNKGNKFTYPKTIKISDLQNKGYIRTNIKVPEGNNMKCIQIKEDKTCSLVDSCS